MLAPSQYSASSHKAPDRRDLTRQVRDWPSGLPRRQPTLSRRIPFRTARPALDYDHWRYFLAHCLDPVPTTTASSPRARIRAAPNPADRPQVPEHLPRDDPKQETPDARSIAGRLRWAICVSRAGFTAMSESWSLALCSAAQDQTVEA